MSIKAKPEAGKTFPFLTHDFIHVNDVHLIIANDVDIFY